MPRIALEIEFCAYTQLHVCARRCDLFRGPFGERRLPLGHQEPIGGPRFGEFVRRIGHSGQ
jgi:hypothetical protein